MAGSFHDADAICAPDREVSPHAASLFDSRERE